MSFSDPAHDAFAVTPSNTVNFTAAVRGLYVGTGGAADSTYQVGPISELILFTSAPSSADRQALERNQGAYFGSPVV